MQRVHGTQFIYHSYAYQPTLHRLFTVCALVHKLLGKTDME